MLNHCKIYGARGRNRTGTGLLPRDFKSHASYTKKTSKQADYLDKSPDNSINTVLIYCKLSAQELLQQTFGKLAWGWL